MTYETQQKIELLKQYYYGLKDGIKLYAHWKDGVQYVGSCGKTLAAAIKDLNIEEEGRIADIINKQ